MIVENMPILTRWAKKNQKHYTECGYKFTGLSDPLYVSVEDWMPMKEDRLFYKCDYCGGIFETNYGSFKKAHKSINKDACTHCVGKKCAEVTMKKRQKNLYERVLNQCAENNYELLTAEDEIVNNRTYIRYVCHTHGEHTMKIANFLSGKKCPDCLADANRKRFRHNQNHISNEVSKLGGKLLNAEEYVNQTTKNLRVICPNCGNEFITSYRNFIQHGGQMCKGCSSQGESLGEMRVRHYLEHNDIAFIQEHWFNDCRDIKPLPFDFYLPNYNTIIEFDGRQHFGDKSYSFFNHSTETTHKHDDIKNKYCEDNGIHLIRIPYWKIDKIDKILNKGLQTHKDIV